MVAATQNIFFNNSGYLTNCSLEGFRLCFIKANPLQGLNIGHYSEYIILIQS
jgi:hypothetical protein